MKKIIKPNKLLCFFVIICPILDIASFLFRNKFNTTYSVSTFVRPIIPIIVYLYLFFKNKNKAINIGAVCMYLFYALIHLYIYKKMMTECTFGTIYHEAQYIVNYSFMIMNLYLFREVFKENKELHSSIIISLAIYIVSIYISIISNTSSSTYIENIGYKGWFESGNSVSAILVLSTFIVMSFITKIQNKAIRIFVFVFLALTGMFLTTLIGTRVGLIGFIFAILVFIIAQFYEKIINKLKINKKVFISLLSVLSLLIILVVCTGSLTLKRRIHLKNMENTIIDESTGEVSNLTGDLTIIKNKIINNNLEQNFMSNSQKQSVLDLYNFARKHSISNTNRRVQQLIYHVMLVKNQKNVILVLFGNGYLINTNELVLEMEFPAILFNFGIFGFILYMVPFLIILFKSIKISIKEYKKIDAECIMLITACLLSFILSTLSGYVFFNSSLMIIIIIANILLENKLRSIKGEGDCKN